MMCAACVNTLACFSLANLSFVTEVCPKDELMSVEKKLCFLPDDLNHQTSKDYYVSPDLVAKPTLV